MATRRSGLSAQSPNAVDRLVELTRVWNGESRDKGERVVQAKELRGIGDALIRRGLATPDDLPDDTGSSDDYSGVQTPNKPQGVEANAAFRNSLVEWAPITYRGHSAAEIWRSLDDKFSNAVLIGSTAGVVFSDSDVEGDTQYWYWVRFVNILGETGPLSDVATTTTAPDIEYLIKELSGEITESELGQTLTTRLDDYGLKIQKHDEQYTVKIDNNGGVAGFGLANEATDDSGESFSEFYVNADRFAVMPQENDKGFAVAPFIVEGGEVYINVARIQNGAITNAKIANLAADKIDATDLSAINANMGTITAGLMRSQDGSFVIDLNSKYIYMEL